MWRLYRVLALFLLNPSLTEVERPIPPLKWRSGRGLKTTGQSDDSGKMKFDQLIDKARLQDTLLGMAIAQVSKLAAVDASPRLKDAEVPWHLILMAIFFTLLKLLGPYYPFWGRILIPHFANGGLLRTLIMVCLFVVQKTPKGIQNGTITTF